MDDSPRTSILPITKSKRRYRSIEEKLKIIEEALVPGASVAAVARSHDLNANLVFQWRKLYRAGLFPPKAGPYGVRLLPVQVEEEIKETKRREVRSSAEENGTIEGAVRQSASSNHGQREQRSGAFRIGVACWDDCSADRHEDLDRCGSDGFTARLHRTECDRADETGERSIRGSCLLSFAGRGHLIKVGLVCCP